MAGELPNMECGRCGFWSYHQLGEQFTCPNCLATMSSAEGLLGDTSRTPRQIVDECNALAIAFYAVEGHRASEGFKMYDSTHPHEQRCWRQAVIAFEHLRCTDVDEVLEELRDEEQPTEAGR